MAQVQKEMIKITLVLIGILLLMPLVSAHAIEKGPIIKSTDNYIIEFSTNPQFPVTIKNTHLDFIIKDKNEDPLSGLNIKIESLKQEKTITSDLHEESEVHSIGHYSTEYNFIDAGNYEIHIVINDKELEIEFDLEIDSFGLSGLLRTGVIVILFLVLIGLIYKDCKHK